MGRIFQKVSVTQSLSIKSEYLRERWNIRVQDPFAFTPRSEIEKGVSKEKALLENMNLGRFAEGYLKQILLQSTLKDVTRRLAGKCKIAAIGYGKGFDSNWLKEASIVAGLETWWIDVSDVVCKWAKEDLEIQYRFLPTTIFKPPKYVVKQAEIESVFSDPASIDLVMSTVEIWYLCRVIGVLSRSTARFILCEMGKTLSEKSDPEKRKSIVLVLALRDNNPTQVACTSLYYSKKVILRHLRKGARRQVEVHFESSYRYFTQVYTAMTIKAK